MRPRLAQKMILAITLIGVFWPGVAAAQDRRITVIGEGRVAAAPDLAVLTLGVVAQDETAGAALDIVSSDLSGVLEVLTGAGIAARDIQTSGLSVQPIYRDTGRSDYSPTLDGYRASSDLTVRVRDLPTLGDVIDRVADAGGNSFAGVSFGVQDPAPLHDAARRAAVTDGTARATLYAEAADVALGDIMEMSETGSGPAPMAAMMESARSMPIAPGEIEITVTLNMVFAIGE